jgi:hypothetical protein
MANRERELKKALICKEEIEDRLAKLEKMRSIKYLNDEVYDVLKGEYDVIKDRSAYLLINLEELNSSQRVNRSQYDALKDAYYLIDKSVTDLLANKSEGHINEEQYKEIKSEYTQKQSSAFIVIANIKSDIKKSLITAENELTRFNQEFNKIDVRFKVGEIKQDDYIKLQRNYQSKIEKSQKSVSGLKNLIEAESSKDISAIVQGAEHPTDISKPPSLSEINVKIPKGVPVSGLSMSFTNFIASLTDRYWCLSPFYKIVIGLLTSAIIAPIFLWIFTMVSALLTVGVTYGTGSGFAMILGTVLSIIGGFGAVLIEIAGYIMIIYGIREMWQDRKA